RQESAMPTKGVWRRGRDSNPRYGCPYAAFRVRCDRPLCHLSVGAKGQETLRSRCLSSQGTSDTQARHPLLTPRSIYGPFDPGTPCTATLVSDRQRLESLRYSRSVPQRGRCGAVLIGRESPRGLRMAQMRRGASTGEALPSESPRAFRLIAFL